MSEGSAELAAALGAPRRSVPTKPHMAVRLGCWCVWHPRARPRAKPVVIAHDCRTAWNAYVRRHCKERP